MSGFLLALRMGMIVGGNATVLEKCSGQAPTTVPGTTAALCDEKDYGTTLDDKSSPSFGVDFLGHAARFLRLGVGVRWVPSTNFGSSAGSSSLGTDLTTAGIVEGIAPASRHLRLALRLEAGMIKLFPGGKYGDSIDDEKKRCSTESCTVDDPSHVGFSLGVGPGLLFPVGGVNMRADLLYQAWWMNLSATSTKTANYTHNLSSERLWLVLGFEFGL